MAAVVAACVAAPEDLVYFPAWAFAVVVAGHCLFAVAEAFATAVPVSGLVAFVAVAGHYAAAAGCHVAVAAGHVVVVLIAFAPVAAFAAAVSFYLPCLKISG